MSGRILTPIQWTLCLVVALLPVAWALNAPLWLGLLLYPEQVAGLMLGLAACTVFLRTVPERTGPLVFVDLALALASLWVGVHYVWRFPVLSEGAFFHPEESLALGIGVAVVSLEGLRQTFRSFVAEHYAGVPMADIMRLTASHYFGIVPLHVNRDHQVAYLQTASALISSLGATTSAEKPVKLV